MESPFGSLNGNQTPFLKPRLELLLSIAIMSSQPLLPQVLFTPWRVEVKS